MFKFLINNSLKKIHLFDSSNLNKKNNEEEEEKETIDDEIERAGGRKKGHLSYQID